MKSLFEQLGGTYHEENGYLIPDLRLPAEEEQSIGIWGQRHLDYLKQYRKVTYINLLTSSRLNAYLAEEQLAKESIPDILFRLVDFMQGREEWSGIATELLAAMGETGTAPNVLTKWMNVH